MAPPPELAEHVVCTWVAVHEAGPSGPVLPDGCVDVLWFADSALVVAGPDTGPVFEQDLPVGGSVYGVRFRSGLAAAGLGVGVDDLRDTRTPLADVWPAAEVTQLAERLAAEPAPEKVLVLCAAVARHRRPASDNDRLVRTAVEQLRARPGRVAELADQLDVGERRLHRRFSSAVGYGPKTLDRIFRFERFRRLAACSTAGLAELAVATGYSDQAHLTRECGRLAGATPVRIVQDARSGGPIPSAV